MTSSQNNEEPENHIVVSVKGLAFGGSFVGDITQGSPEVIGKKAFLREVISGETAQALITESQKNLVHASLMNVQEPSPHRVTVPCPYFSSCGGCDLQHIDLAFQRAEKRRMVEQTLLLHGKVTPKEGVALIGENLPGYHYRSRILLHLNRDGQLGFYKQKTGDVVPIEACLLAKDSLNKTLHKIKSIVPSLQSDISSVLIEEHDGQIFIVLKLRDPEQVRYRNFELNELKRKMETALRLFPNLKLSAKEKPLYIQENFVEFKLDAGARPAGHFAQVNPDGNEILIDAVCKEIKGKDITEFYAGAGNFSFPLARLGKKVECIEVDDALVSFGRKRAEELGLAASVQFVKESTESFASRGKFRKTVLLDPPRAGAKKLCETLSAAAVDEVVYVSCNLPSLARDLQILSVKGFDLKKVLVVDMFPQTHHVETISVLKKAVSDS